MSYLILFFVGLLLGVLGFLFLERKNKSLADKLRGWANALFNRFDKSAAVLLLLLPLTGSGADPVTPPPAEESGGSWWSLLVVFLIGVAVVVFIRFRERNTGIKHGTPPSDDISPR